jgi:hypothetical protein
MKGYPRANALALVSLALCSACTGIIGSDPDATEAMRAAAIDPGAQGLVRITESPFPSLAIDGAFVDIWVSAGAASSYAEIRPSIAGSGVSLRSGAVIVREVFEKENAQPSKVSVAYRSDETGSPQDWSFGLFHPADGTELSDASTTDACLGCHSSRPQDGFLFGVPENALGDEYL